MVGRILLQLVTVGLILAVTLPERLASRDAMLHMAAQFEVLANNIKATP